MTLVGQTGGCGQTTGHLQCCSAELGPGGSALTPPLLLGQGHPSCIHSSLPGPLSHPEPLRGQGHFPLPGFPLQELPRQSWAHHTG